MAVLMGSGQLAGVQRDDAQGHVTEAMFSLSGGDNNFAADALSHPRYPGPAVVGARTGG